MLKNIVIVNDSASINGGAGKVALTSAIGLANCGYNVIIFTAFGPVDKRLENIINLRIICLNQMDILSDPNRWRAVKQGIWNRVAYEEFNNLLLTLNPKDTIVHFHAWIKSLSASLFSITAKYNLKIVITLHDYFLFCPNGGLFNYQTKKICKVKALSLRCLLCNCDSRSYLQKVWRYVRQMIQQHVFYTNKEINIIYISKLNKDISYPYLSTHTNRWYFVQNPIELNLQDPVNIVYNKKYLFIARLSSEKGIELFCQAMTDLNLEGCVLGDGYLKESLQQKYPNVEFVGWVTGRTKDLFIRQGKALVFPSLWYEGAPLTIIEMKSYGIPCIVPDQCSASEEIIDGQTGYIFKTGDLDSLKLAIKKYENADIQEKQDKLLSAFDLNKYTMENHCVELIKVYNDILDKY